MVDDFAQSRVLERALFNTTTGSSCAGDSFLKEVGSWRSGHLSTSVGS